MSYSHSNIRTRTGHQNHDRMLTPPTRRAGIVGCVLFLGTLAMVVQTPAQDAADPPEPTEAVEQETPPQGIPATDRPGPQPQPLRPTPFQPRSNAETVRVDADGSGFFDAEENKATFTDNVRVEHPSFNLTADHLDVYLEDSNQQPGNGSPVESSPEVIPNDPAADGDDMGIRLAIARGRRVVIHRVSDEGELMVGTCRHATFDGRTREMTLRDWPQVQKGPNLIRAVEQSAIIILTEDGQVRTQGRVRTELVRDADENAGRVIAPPAGPNP